jgi:hypothetical protein
MLAFSFRNMLMPLKHYRSNLKKNQSILNMKEIGELAMISRHVYSVFIDLVPTSQSIKRFLIGFSFLTLSSNGTMILHQVVAVFLIR